MASSTKPLKVGSVFTSLVDGPPSCVEFSPFFRHVFVIGTYSLIEDASLKVEDDGEIKKVIKENAEEQVHEKSEKKTQSRSGSILLYYLMENLTVEVLQTISTSSAVLDLHFSPQASGNDISQDILAVALSTGIIELYKLQDAQHPALTRWKRLQVSDSSVLVLSLAWNPYDTGSSMIAATLSDGTIVVLNHLLDEAVLSIIQAHELEAWTVAWAHKSQNIVYSGGDDSHLATFREIHSSWSKGKKNGPLWNRDEHGNSPITTFDPRGAGQISKTVNTKIHEAGVTAILPLKVQHLSNAEVLVTGSYDECIRVLIADRPEAPNYWTVLAKRNLGGGVWKLQLLESPQVLASCMHAGTRVIDLSSNQNGKWSIEIFATFEEHESMNYGTAATSLFGVHSTQAVVSTSFYDRKLCVWQIPE